MTHAPDVSHSEPGVPTLDQMQIGTPVLENPHSVCRPIGGTIVYEKDVHFMRHALELALEFFYE
jgi:hypothetical protein